MMNPESSSGGGSEARYKGVRRRKWGKWVSEVRLPNSRERIWLGSYDSPEKAARAFDAAAFCLRGKKAQLNFPNDMPPTIQSPRSLTHQQIQQVATRHAYSSCTSSYSARPSYCENPAALEDQVTNVPTAASDGFSVAAMDWSFLDLDLMTVPATDFCYNFIPTGTSTETEHEEGEEGESGSSSSLWSF